MDRGALADPAGSGAIEAAGRLLEGRRVVVVSGAGMSTRSGIPDYRGEGTRRRAKAPIMARAFLGQAQTRRRYWARAVVGWPRFAAAQPNAAHRAVARLLQSGLAGGLITQNVDGLDRAAGSDPVIELHGALSRVRCLDCGRLSERAALQTRLVALNPALTVVRAAMAPDGDAELPDSFVQDFVVADCAVCRGILKPDVVFFGESVPPSTTARAWATFDAADALLVAGSSLAVFSGYRFVRRAAKRGIPIVIANAGPTRGDAEATLRIDGDLTETLPRLLEALARP